MHPLKQFRYDIAASLWHKPAGLKELCKRDFLKNIADFNVDRALFYLEKDGIVYEKNDIFYTYKSAIKVLNKEGYELS